MYMYMHDTTEFPFQIIIAFFVPYLSICSQFKRFMMIQLLSVENMK